MDIEQGNAVSPDGTRIATYLAGPAKAPVMVLSNGLGGNVYTWKHLIEHFHDRFRIISWDYRGLYESPPAVENRYESYAIEKHCEDLRALLDSEEVNEAIFLGWSMGVQVNLEYFRLDPQRFSSMVHINGTFGRPFDTAFGSSFLSVLGPPFLDILKQVEPLMRSVGPLVTRTRALIALAKATGFASPTLDEDVFFRLAGDYVNLDFTAYTHTFKQMVAHDARDVPATVDRPCLVITGEKDLFTPTQATREIIRDAPDVEFMSVKGGTHYTPIEYPMVVNLRIEKFLRERLDVDR